MLRPPGWAGMDAPRRARIWEISRGLQRGMPFCSEPEGVPQITICPYFSYDVLITDVMEY